MASISNNGGRSSKPASAMEVEHTQPLTVPVQLVAVGQRPASQELPTPTSVEHNNQHPSVMLEIDDQERKVFETLNAVVRRLSEDGSQFSIPDRPQVKHIQVRIAGGWVRDKLLGLETHDIDIALDTCSGVEFATLVQTYMESEHTNHEEERRHSKIGIIAANPTQSKHLETATMRIMGLEVDFSNLRHEQYSSDSRIPTTVLGTPLEDAFRRDFTINTLFFNLSTMCLEDWTHRAFVDLKQGIVSTPLEAYQTFHDDPLRILRSIRFSCRYDMQLEEDIEQCCLIPQLHHELHKKVSRERVGKELEGMISGKSARPKAALETLLRLKLAGSVFDIPTSPLLGSIGIQSPTPYEGDPAQLAHLREHAWEETRGCLELLPDLIVIIKSEIVSIAESSLDGQSISSKVDERMLHLAVFCLPFFDLRYLQKKKEKLVAEYMIKEGIKFSNKDTTSILSLVQGFPGVTTLLASSPPPSGSWTPEQRLAAGLFVKQLSDMWVTSLILGTVALIQKNGPTSSEQWKERMSQWYRTIIGMKLDACWKELPLLNGKAIIEALGLSRGPRVGLYTQKEAEWRLMYPGGTMDDCLKFLKAVQKEQEKDEEETMHHIDKKMHL